MLFARIKRLKNRKGVTLVEMVVAMAIVAILATVLSMMIVPVMNAYTINETQTRLAEAVDSRLNDMAMYLRGATGVYLSTAVRNTSKKWLFGYTNGKPKAFSDTDTTNMPTEGDGFLPELRRSDNNKKTMYDGVRTTQAIYSFVMDNYHERESGVSGYFYPEMVIASYDPDNPTGYRYYGYAGSFNMKLQSDDYQSQDFWCPDNKSMFFYVRQNPDDNNSATVLEMHLAVKQGKVTYEGVKTIVCETLVIKGVPIRTNNFYNWSQNSKGEWVIDYKTATVSTDKNRTPYYTVWFSREKFKG